MDFAGYFHMMADVPPFLEKEMENTMLNITDKDDFLNGQFFFAESLERIGYISKKKLLLFNLTNILDFEI